MKQTFIKHAVIIILLMNCCVISLQSQRTHYIDENNFWNALDQRIDHNVIGYQFAVGDESGILFSGSTGWAKSPSDGSVPWNNSLKMMSASIAKMIATVAIMDMLESATIPGATTLEQKLNLKLKDYIPIRWRSLINGREDDVTLRHLLNHQSGFVGTASIHPEIVLAATMNTPVPDAYEYANTNFNLAGFMAVYMTNPATMTSLENSLVIFGNAFYNSSFTNEIREIYQQYVKQNILIPSGINTECAKNLSPNDTDVYMYDGKQDINGYNMGTISTCMSNGWMLSAEDMVRFMAKWDNPSQAGNILTQESVNLINQFGAVSTTTPLGWVWDRDTYDNQIEGFGHNGIWRSSDLHLFTSGIVLTQDNVYMAINVNSYAPDSNREQRGLDLVAAYNTAVCPLFIVLDEAKMEALNSAMYDIETVEITVADVGEYNIMKAGERVTLHPGFHAKTGAKFRAYLDVCENLPKID